MSVIGRARWVFVIGILCGSSGILGSCTYQFTNDAIVRPDGVRTIAVEAVYDTSREVVPHELLWEALQLGVAADGHLRLVGQKDADILMRAHLKSAQISAGGTELYTGSKKDPDPYTQETPPTPDQFSNLTLSGRYRDSGAVSYVVEVEVYHLKTHKLLFKQNYGGSEGFGAVHQTANRQFTVPENDFLRYDEAVTAKFKNIARGIGRSAVRDFLLAVSTSK